VQLRNEIVNKVGEPKVLDLFAGNNVLWSFFETKRYYGVEQQKGKGKNLYADNRRIIKSLDLSDFNIIDCDSYGIPITQIQLLYQNNTLKNGTYIIYTAIGNSISALNKQLLVFYNLETMYKKCKTLFNKMSNEFFHAYLYDLGIKEVREYEEYSPTFTKKYGYFKVEK
jgi:hypothetical protein